MIVGFNTYPLSSGHNKRGVGFSAKYLLRELEKSDIEIVKFLHLSELKEVDVVHYPWFDLFFRSLPLRKRFPTVVTIHDVMPLVFSKYYPIGVKGRINLSYQRLSLKGVKYVITDSSCSKKDIVKFLNFPEEKVVIISLAPAEEFKVLEDAEKIRIKRRIHLPDRYLLYVGDANYVKNLPFLIKGFKQVSNKFKDLKLVLVNDVFKKNIDKFDHPELKSLKQFNGLINEYGLENRVMRLGQLETNELVGVYNLALIYIQPSLYEGFGLPVLEAMKCATPVISSNAGSLKEIGGDAVFYFDPYKLGEFIVLLTDVLESKSIREKYADLGLKQASKFSWRKAADEIISIYQQAANK